MQHILADAMQQFFPDIPFVTEYLLADRWYKGLDDQPTDESGRIVPLERPPDESAEIIAIERLGGLLRSDRRAA